jgi:hypothetical protein
MAEYIFIYFWIVIENEREDEIECLSLLCVFFTSVLFNTSVFTCLNGNSLSISENKGIPEPRITGTLVIINSSIRSCDCSIVKVNLQQKDWPWVIYTC